MGFSKNADHVAGEVRCLLPTFHTTAFNIAVFKSNIKNVAFCNELCTLNDEGVRFETWF